MRTKPKAKKTVAKKVAKKATATIPITVTMNRRKGKIVGAVVKTGRRTIAKYGDNKTSPLEKEIEKKVCQHAKEVHGCYVRKFTSPGQVSVPDRLFITPAGRVFFIEFKRAGAVVTVKQAVEHALIKATGIRVHVVDDIEAGKAIVTEEALGL